jgi:hypothetical protein
MNRVFICLSASRGLFSWIIRKLTKSKYNHAYILYTSYLFGGWWAVQIDQRGVRKLPASQVTKKYYLNTCYEYEFNLDRGLQHTRSMVGAKYDWLGILGFFVKLLVKKIFKKEIGNLTQSKSRNFCSEYVASVLKYSNAFGFQKCNPAEMDPDDIDDIISHHGAYSPRKCPEDQC